MDRTTVFKILIVDDEEDVREILSDILLSGMGNKIEIHSVSNGQEALDLIKNAKYGLVIMDLMMPILSGEDFLNEVMNIPEVLRPEEIWPISGNSSKLQEIKEKYKNIQVIEKPFYAERIIHMLDLLMHPVKNQYVTLPILLMEKYSHKFPFDIYMALSATKIIKIGHSGEDRKITLQRYIDKGVTSFYAKKNDFEQFYQELKNIMKDKKEFERKSEKEKIDYANVSHAVLKSLFVNFSISEQLIDFAQEMTNCSIKIIAQTKNLKRLLIEFKKNASKEYFIACLTSYFVNMQIDCFDWKSKQIKEKVSLAVFVCDVTLESEDFETIRRCKSKPKMLSKKILDHPMTVVNLCQKEFSSFSFDIKNVILQHHERPDGSGFPTGTTHSKISLLSAIHIVAREFVEEMVNVDLAEDQIIPILQEMQNIYYLGKFKDAFKSLQEVLGRLKLP